MAVLVQRLLTGRIPEGESLDERFRMDYMGSAEFEWGILPGSLRVMKGQDNVIHKLESDNGLFWFFGPFEYLPKAMLLISGDGRSFEGRRLKEGMRLKDDLVCGWWFLSRDGFPSKEKASLPTWCVFRNEDYAKSWSTSSCFS